MDDLIASLFRINAVRFGSFTLKSGIVSPIYIDLRCIVSYPGILKAVARAIWENISHASFDVVCGVPYTALPIATAISLERQVPMVMRRKEIKEYGLKKAIEGVFTPGQRCLVIEDLVTSGSSVLETAAALRAEGLLVTDAVVLLDREQGGRKNLHDQGIQLHSVVGMADFLNVLANHRMIDTTMLQQVREFLESQNQVAAHA